MPFGDLECYAYDSVKNGDSFYVHRHVDKPKRSLLFWQANDDKSDSFYGVNGQWEVHDYVAPALRNKLKVLLTRLEPPKPVIIRQQANPASNPTPDNDKPRDERHMFQLEVDSENDVPLPEKLYITLVAFNKTQDARPVHQVNDIVWDFESRIFRAKPGDSFEVFAITDQMKAVKKDLRDNKNLTQSVNDQLIAPLEITDTYNRADDVVVHTVKYVVPEVRNLIINHEFGLNDKKPRNDMFVLVNEDNDWLQTIHAGIKNTLGYGNYDEDGWIQLIFQDIPKSGKFSLYNYRKNSNGSPVTLISDLTETEILQEKQYQLLDTGDSTSHQMDNHLYMEAKEWDDWLEEFIG
jgi:hypothetical protein